MKKISNYCGESLLKGISTQLEGIISVYSKEEGIEACKELSEAWSLCNKIITNDYFSKSEPIIEEFYQEMNGGNWIVAEEIKKKWNKQYKKDRKVKQNDLHKLFEIIENNIEDWC